MADDKRYIGVITDSVADITATITADKKLIIDKCVVSNPDKFYERYFNLLIDGNPVISEQGVNFNDAVPVALQGVPVFETEKLQIVGDICESVGDSTTQIDITNPSGTTFRYTWDSTGTDPDFDGNFKIGDGIRFNAQNFTAANSGHYYASSCTPQTQ